MFKFRIFLFFLINYCDCQYYIANNRFKDLQEVFSWKQIGYDFNGVKYVKDENREKKPDGVSIYFDEEVVKVDDTYFIQYNNIPIGLEVYQDRVFITVPRRRYGIPSTLNYVDLKSSGTSSLLKPYPSADSVGSLISTYRPRADSCGRLWVVDTGLLEIPDKFKQIKPPYIIVYDLKTNQEVLQYEIPSDVLINGTTSGLTSITVDVTPNTCDDAFAYINDLAQDGLIVFSMKQRSSWRFRHSTFSHDVGAVKFPFGDLDIDWTDGLFSIALSDPGSDGSRTAYYHPFISTQEFSISTNVLKNKSADIEKNFKTEGVRGPFSQSGSHDYHSGTKVLLYANIAQDAIMCWNTKTPLVSKISAPVAQSHEKLTYISDLKVVGDDVWVFVNQIPNFIYKKLNTTVSNFYVYRGKVRELIKDSACDI